MHNAIFPPEDEDMVMPSPASVPWAGTQDVFLPSSAFAPGELGDMSLFPDFRPIQTPNFRNSEHPDRNHEGPPVRQSERIWEVQQPLDHGADSPDLFAEFTWEDGFQAMEEFNWSVPESSGNGKDLRLDAAAPNQDAHNTFHDATTTQKDAIMADISENMVQSSTHPAMEEAPATSPKIPSLQHDIMDDIVDSVPENTSPITSDES